MDLSTQWLRVLQAVFETGSFTAAAERLGFTQSAVSKQVRSLEQACGQTLFQRRARGVELTSAGTLLLARAAVVLDQLDAASRELSSAGSSVTGKIALGAFPTAAMELVPRTMARLRRAHPDISLEFIEASTPVQLRRLRAGRLDLAVVAVGEDLPDYDVTGLQLEDLPTGPLLLAVPYGHVVHDLQDQDWIVGEGAPGEPQFGAWPTLPEPHVVARAADWTTRLGFVAAGLGVTTLPSLAAGAVPAGVVTVKVDDPARRPRQLTLAWVGQLTPAAAVVRSILHTEADRIATR